MRKIFPITLCLSIFFVSGLTYATGSDNNVTTGSYSVCQGKGTNAKGCGSSQTGIQKKCTTSGCGGQTTVYSNIKNLGKK